MAAVEAAIVSWGIAAEIVGPVAVALLAAAGAVKVCKEMSTTGAVGLKFTMLPLPVIVPYPV